MKKYHHASFTLNMMIIIFNYEQKINYQVNLRLILG